MEKAEILVVDDNPINLKLVKVVLTIEGYKLRTASDANQALDVLKEFRPDLILMDLQLPGMDGLQLTKLLKVNPMFKDVIILAITAYAMKGDEERVLAAGCDGYISKPIDTQALPKVIEKYLKDKLH